MKKCLKTIFLLLFFGLLLIKPCYASNLSCITQNIPSLGYITQAHGQITLVQGDEEYYVVSQNRTNNEITNSSKNDNSDVIFGEDALTEDNILQHYIFSKEKLEQHRKYNKLSPILKNSVYTRAP